MSNFEMPHPKPSREECGRIVATLKSELAPYQEADLAGLRAGHAELVRIKNSLDALHEEDLSAQDEDEKFALMTKVNELLAKIPDNAY